MYILLSVSLYLYYEGRKGQGEAIQRETNSKREKLLSTNKKIHVSIEDFRRRKKGGVRNQDMMDDQTDEWRGITSCLDLLQCDLEIHS